jgi:hypothetical protein
MQALHAPNDQKVLCLNMGFNIGLEGDRSALKMGLVMALFC